MGLVAAVVLVVAAVVAGVVIGAASLIEVPYVIVAPGSARPIDPQVTVEGAPEYPPAGQIHFVTITEDDHVTRLEKFQADRDPDVAVRPRVRQEGDLTRDENARLNQVFMNQSKDMATLVALTRLGYDIGATTTGALVVQVVAGGPSDGILRLGDTIVAFDGQPVADDAQLRELIAARAGGDVVTLSIEAPDGTPSEVRVTLGVNPDEAAQGRTYLGIHPSSRVSYNLPFEVDIDSGRVGGPSAGLAYTLGIIDRLTEGELTGGKDIAVTGTIAADGSVGSIGGISEKVTTVIRAGIEVFLVPADVRCGEEGGSCNYSEALAKADGRIDIVPVASLDDALNVLAALGGNADQLPPAPSMPVPG